MNHPKKTTVEATYRFVITYENDEHLDSLMKQIQHKPVFDIAGAGVCSDGKMYSYRCARKGGAVRVEVAE